MEEEEGEPQIKGDVRIEEEDKVTSNNNNNNNNKKINEEDCSPTIPLTLPSPNSSHC